MKKHLFNPFYYFMALLACSTMALTSGCASGGFKLTRQYAGWVNSQNIILRIILYILTMVVFGVTLLIDAVVFNTMDFWEGRVSQGNFNFKEGDKTYQVLHETIPDSQLRRSTIQIFGSDNRQIQLVVLQETPKNEIELYVDGVLRTKVANISAIPVASLFDAKGKLVEQKDLWLPTLLPIQYLARN